MNKWIFSSLLFFCLVIGANAQIDKTEEKSPQEKSEIISKSEALQSDGEKSLLWEISGKDLKTPSYLYGTIHMIGKEDFFLTEATKEAFSKSDKVTFEINMEKMSDMSALFSLLGNLMMDNGKSLKDLISAEDYALVQKHFQEIGMPLMMFERMKPMFLSTFADADLAQGGAFGSGESDIVSYEMKFMEMAQKGEKAMDGLETIEFQMSIFDSIPYEAQAQMLVEGIKAEKDTVQTDSEFDEMVKLYKAQDIEAMQSMFDGESEGGIGQYEEILLVNRNKNWIPIMAKMMSEQRTFFAVGAGHLGGEMGVIQLLREEGYELKPLF